MSYNSADDDSEIRDHISDNDERDSGRNNDTDDSSEEEEEDEEQLQAVCVFFTFFIHFHINLIFRLGTRWVHC